MKVKTLYGEYEVSLEVAYYMNGNLAIQLYDKEDGCPFAIITTNTDVVLESPNDGITEFALIDTNNCPWAEDFLKSYHLGWNTGEYVPSGFCEYPIWELDAEALKHYEHESSGEYAVRITVTCTKDVYINADSESEAMDIVYENFFNEEEDYKFTVPDDWCYGDVKIEMI